MHAWTIVPWNVAKRTSRVRFWLYLLGPFLVGVAAAPGLPPSTQLPALLLNMLWWSFPANLFLYGVNDAADLDTDAQNTKKDGYESRLSPSDAPALLRTIAGLTLPFLLLWLVWAPLAPTRLWFAAFLFLSVSYSLPPLRLKARPFLDSTSNALYAVPGIIGYLLAGGSVLDTRLLLAAALWCAAMHAFSAIPDIEADRAAHLSTIATTLGRRGTLLFCLALYACAATLAILATGFALFKFLGAGYVLLMLHALRVFDAPMRFFAVYRAFPFINTVAGMLLFAWSLWLTS